METTETEAITRLAHETLANDRVIAGTDLHGGAEAELLAFTVRRGESLVTIDTEGLADEPRRSRGTVKVYDAESFIAETKRRAGMSAETLAAAEPAGLVLYADEHTLTLSAVLNDDHDLPGWRDYRVELDVRTRPEWDLWVSKDGELIGQEAFARHIERGLPELRIPSGADALELAQTFHANIGTSYKSGRRLANGTAQIVYEEAVDATAGRDGSLTIPEEWELAIRPFYGTPSPLKVTARFRFSIPRGGGEVKFGYDLNRPDDVKRFAFAEVVEQVANGLGVTAVNGPAPSNAHAAARVEVAHENAG